MFSSCSSLQSLNLSGWDVSKMDNVLDISDCTNLIELNLDGWNYTSVKNTISKSRKRRNMSFLLCNHFLLIFSIY